LSKQNLRLSLVVTRLVWLSIPRPLLFGSPFAQNVLDPWACPIHCITCLKLHNECMTGLMDDVAHKRFGRSLVHKSLVYDVVRMMSPTVSVRWIRCRGRSRACDMFMVGTSPLRHAHFSDTARATCSYLRHRPCEVLVFETPPVRHAHA
jgi:hypothetical protein